VCYKASGPFAPEETRAGSLGHVVRNVDALFLGSLVTPEICPFLVLAELMGSQGQTTQSADYTVYTGSRPYRPNHIDSRLYKS
jgi:hypothetical protein